MAQPGPFYFSEIRKESEMPNNFEIKGRETIGWQPF